MYAFVVLLGLALALAVVREVIDEVVPVKTPKAIGTTLSVLIAIGVCWALDYSVFTAFGQDLRSAWMHPVASGVLLVALGEFFRSLPSLVVGTVRGRTA